jgi:tartrate-resistant acid phosphatase type 5
MPAKISRRRALQTLFCSSAALALNLRSGAAAPAAEPDALHLISIGDFGTTGEFQVKVAQAMQQFVQGASLQPHGLLLLGDNFYSKVKDGFSVKSERWRTGFEEMYPADPFPGRCWSILGNHDYHDNAGGEQVQLAYSAQGNTRWTMPAKWYRLDLGSPQPVVTVLAVDSNLPTVSGGTDKKTNKPRGSLTVAEAEQQLAWLKAELAKPRAPFTIVMGHHPLYSNGSHGDTKALIDQWGGLLEQHRVHAYLCGHDHDLQHLELQDRCTSFVLSGGGGARTREMKNPHPGPYSKDVYGFTHIQAKPTDLTFAHHGLDGAMLHRFTKRVDGAVEIG